MNLNNTFQDLHLSSIPHRTTNTKTCRYEKTVGILFRQEEKTYYKDTQIIVNNRGIIIHKTDLKKGARHDYDIYKKDNPVTPKEVVIMYLTLDI